LSSPYSSADTLTLHSFPTRRSSDLFRRGQRGFQALHVHFAVAGNADPEELPLLFTRGPRLDHDVLEGVGGGERTAQACVVEELQDRKSTRLNSSHVKISYAVFCLKK